MIVHNHLLISKITLSKKLKLKYYLQNVIPDSSKYCGPYKPPTVLKRDGITYEDTAQSYSHDTIGNLSSLQFLWL